MGYVVFWLTKGKNRIDVVVDKACYEWIPLTDRLYYCVLNDHQQHGQERLIGYEPHLEYPQEKCC